MFSNQEQTPSKAMTVVKSFARRLGVVLMIAAYAGFGLLLVTSAPRLFVHDSDFSGLKDEQKVMAVASERSSIRTSLVTLFGASAFGVAGIVAVLTYRSSSRSRDVQRGQSQDTLFAKALELCGSNTNDAGIIGGLQLLSAIAGQRLDLRESAFRTAISIVRARTAMAAPLALSEANRAVRPMHDRDPVALNALVVLGQIGLERDNLHASTILTRTLAGCDFRGTYGGSLIFEVVSFVGSTFWDCRLNDVRFVGCAFMHSTWRGSDLVDVEFIQCDLTGVDLGGVDLSRVTFERCRGR